MPARHAVLPARQARNRPIARPAPECLFLIVRVDPRHVFLAHRHLRQSRPRLLCVRMLSDPDRHGQASFLVQLRQDDAGALMHHLMTHLPAAEFGRLGPQPMGIPAP